MNLKNQSFLRTRFCVLFLVNLLIFVYSLFCTSPNVSCESYPEYSRYLCIIEEKLDLSNDSHHDNPKILSVGKLAAEIIGGCALNLSSLLICVNTIKIEGDDPGIGIAVSAILAPLISSFGVTGVGYLVKDEGSWAGSLIGAYIPVLASIFIAHHLGQYSSDDALFSIFICSQCSPILAVIGYKLGRPLAKYKWLNYVLTSIVIANLCYVLTVLP